MISPLLHSGRVHISHRSRSGVGPARTARYTHARNTRGRPRTVSQGSRRIRSTAIETGQVIAGHYRLVERIGSGGTGVVWRAVDERLERSVAIKQILTQPSLPPGEKEIVRQRASREARNAARFQHPNAIVVFDIHRP